MNGDLKKLLAEQIEANFGYMSEDAHKTLDKIRADEPLWCTGDEE